MSKKISEFVTLTVLESNDWLTGLDADQPDENLQNVKITKTNALADYQPVVPTGGANYLGQSPNWVTAGNSATRDVGTGAGDVAAGNAPDTAVAAHTSAIDHTLIQTANQKDAADAANAPSDVNPYATINDVPQISGLHSDLTDLTTSGHPGTVIKIPGGVQGNAVSIAADESLQDAGQPVGAANHAGLPDLDSSGHPGTVINIAGGVEGNAVAIAADGTLVDSGIPPGGTGGAGVSKGTPFITDDLVAVQNAAGDGVIKSVGFAPGDVARTSQENVFTGATQAIQSPSDIFLRLFKTGTVGQEGLWDIENRSGLLTFRSKNDSEGPAEASAELFIGHGNNVLKGVGLGAVTLQGHGTLNSQNGLYDDANRVYSLSNVPPLFTDSANGYVPASGGGTVNFLRADGTFAAPPGEANTVDAVQGSNSITVSPTTGTPIVGLQGDAASPGNSKYWGTSGAGVKGFHDLPPGGGGWQDGTTIADWGEAGQLLTPTGDQTFDLDNGHFFYNTTAMTGDKTINFQSTANHDNTPWTALIDLGSRTVNWEFNSVAIKTAEGYNISAGGLFLFTFTKAGSTVVVSERGITP